ncbi:MAG: glycosyltransferase, partial [Alphaproteobacteria bacterium]|nr:glycosyltransferase [Alphaproteobacteria bacterium]
MKKLSVIIPVYNVAEYLAECLTSVCNQTLTDIEIICVNDGSTDNSGDILQDFAKQDTRIQIINQENAGLSAARNSGLNYSTGEYITVLDSDDWIALDYYE